MHRTNRYLVAMVMLLGISNSASLLWSQQRVIDRIVAVVDKEIITESELNERVNMVVFQSRMESASPEFRRDVLDGMIADKLILAQALIDSIEVTNDEVSQALDQQIANLVRQAGSEQRVEDYYGMPISRIRREFREDMRKQLIVQRMRQTREAAIQVTRREVEEFFSTYQDSLPRVPEEVELSNIFIQPKPDSTLQVESERLLKSIRDSLLRGGDFAEYARRYSKGPGGESGGELPWAKRGELLRDFEEVVFSLSEGEISQVFTTELGLHLVQLEERRGESVRARQILLPLPKGPASDTVAVRRLRELRDEIQAGTSFADMAKKYSEDEDTKMLGGDLGRVSLDQLDPEFRTVVETLPVGTISEPHRVAVGNSYGYQIVWLRQRMPAHAMNLTDDFRRIEQIALYFKRNEQFNSWVADLKKNIYWEVRI